MTSMRGPEPPAPERVRCRAGVSAEADPGTRSFIKKETKTWVWTENLPDGSRAVMKMYRRRDRFVALRGRLCRYRAEREYQALAHLSRYGVPCCEPLFWMCGRSSEHGRYEVLATREIAGAVSLRDLARQRNPGDIFGHLPGLFRIIRRMHESGLYHGVLKVDNILVSSGPSGLPSFHVIDTPRALVFPESIVGSRMARRDLHHLAFTLEESLGLAAHQIPLSAYGGGASTTLWFIRQQPRFRRAKGPRRLLRVEFVLRLAVARLSEPVVTSARTLGHRLR